MMRWAAIFFLATLLVGCLATNFYRTGPEQRKDIDEQSSTSNEQLRSK